MSHQAGVADFPLRPPAEQSFEPRAKDDGASLWQERSARLTRERGSGTPILAKQPLLEDNAPSPASGLRPIATGKVIFAMTMSLDGFVNDERGGVDQLYPDLETLRDTTLRREVVANTGAVVMGWKSFAMAEDPDWYASHYEHQVPIFVVTRDAPEQKPKETRELTFTFVTNGIESAILRAKHDARARDVRIVGGARSLQRCIRARLVNELHIDIMPVLLGRGLRLFEHLGPAVELTRTRVLELPAGRTHIEFRIGR